MRATMDGPATGSTTLKTGKNRPPAVRGRDPTTMGEVRILAVGRGIADLESGGQSALEVRRRQAREPTWREGQSRWREARPGSGQALPPPINPQAPRGAGGVGSVRRPGGPTQLAGDGDLARRGSGGGLTFRKFFSCAPSPGGNTNTVPAQDN